MIDGRGRYGAPMQAKIAPAKIVSQQIDDVRPLARRRPATVGKREKQDSNGGGGH